MKEFFFSQVPVLMKRIIRNFQIEKLCWKVLTQELILERSCGEIKQDLVTRSCQIVWDFPNGIF